MSNKNIAIFVIIILLIAVGGGILTNRPAKEIVVIDSEVEIKKTDESIDILRDDLQNLNIDGDNVIGFVFEEDEEGNRILVTNIEDSSQRGTPINFGRGSSLDIDEGSSLDIDEVSERNFEVFRARTSPLSLLSSNFLFSPFANRPIRRFRGAGNLELPSNVFVPETFTPQTFTPVTPGIEDPTETSVPITPSIEDPTDDCREYDENGRRIIGGEDKICGNIVIERGERPDSAQNLKIRPIITRNFIPPNFAGPGNEKSYACVAQILASLLAGIVLPSVSSFTPDSYISCVFDILGFDENTRKLAGFAIDILKTVSGADPGAQNSFLKNPNEFWSNQLTKVASHFISRTKFGKKCGIEDPLRDYNTKAILQEYEGGGIDIDFDFACDGKELTNLLKNKVISPGVELALGKDVCQNEDLIPEEHQRLRDQCEARIAETKESVKVFEVSRSLAGNFIVPQIAALNEEKAKVGNAVITGFDALTNLPGVTAKYKVLDKEGCETDEGEPVLTGECIDILSSRIDVQAEFDFAKKIPGLRAIASVSGGQSIGGLLNSALQSFFKEPAKKGPEAFSGHFETNTLYGLSGGDDLISRWAIYKGFDQRGAAPLQDIYLTELLVDDLIFFLNQIHANSNTEGRYGRGGIINTGGINAIAINSDIQEGLRRSLDGEVAANNNNPISLLQFTPSLFRTIGSILTRNSITGRKINPSSSCRRNGIGCNTTLSSGKYIQFKNDIRSSGNTVDPSNIASSALSDAAALRQAHRSSNSLLTTYRTIYEDTFKAQLNIRGKSSEVENGKYSRATETLDAQRTNIIQSNTEYAAAAASNPLNKLNIIHNVLVNLFEEGDAPVYIHESNIRYALAVDCPLATGLTSYKARKRRIQFIPFNVYTDNTVVRTTGSSKYYPTICSLKELNNKYEANSNSFPTFDNLANFVVALFYLDRLETVFIPTRTRQNEVIGTYTNDDRNVRLWNILQSNSPVDFSIRIQDLFTIDPISFGPVKAGELYLETLLKRPGNQFTNLIIEFNGIELLGINSGIGLFREPLTNITKEANKQTIENLNFFN